MARNRGKNKKQKKTQSDKSGVAKVDKTPVIHQNSKLQVPLNIFNRELTPRQKEFVELALDNKVKMLVVSGPAGTSKTFLSVYASLLLMNKQRVSDLVYVRSVVESSDVKLGFLPGEKNDKMSPYRQPLVDKLDEFLSSGDVKKLNDEERIEAHPVGYLRGLNWNAMAIIGDEMQNCTRKELITLMTRVGEFSKLFLLGDPSQADINRSGFKDVYNLFNDEESRENGIYTFEFTEEDIVRSKLVRFITKKVKKLS
jgi:phosphate starvation-inducible protein PhoH